MGLLGTVVIPLISTAIKHQYEKEIVAQKAEEERKLEDLKHANTMQEAETKSTLNKEESVVKSNLVQSNWEKQYYKDLVRNVITGTAGGIAAGAAKGYFSNKFHSTDSKKNNSNRNDNPKPPTPKGGATVTPDNKEKQINDKIWNWLGSPGSDPLDLDLKKDEVDLHVLRQLEQQGFGRTKPSNFVLPGLTSVPIPMFVL